MQFKQYTNIHDFYDDTYKVLMRHESQNMILLGNIIIGHEGKDKTDWRDHKNWFMATVSDKNGILLTALMTPPHNITLYATDNVIHSAAVDCLIKGLKDIEVPGVITEKELAECFTHKYTSQKSGAFTVTMNQRIYELTAINPDIKLLGKLRLLNENDIYFFPYWLEAFNIGYGKTEMFVPQNADPYLYRISAKKLYILEVDGIPVSMAGYTREMETAVGVAFVYTPPYFRKNGYATSCVAQLSRMALEKGFSKCVLYTDLANPISNSIYQKIGYVPVCDSVMLSFK